jgi:hypothetical protein
VRFRSKVDWWIGLLVGGALLFGPVALALAGEWAVLPLTLLAPVIVAFLCWPCDYTLMEDHLLVRSGLVKWRVPYGQIEHVYPTRNPLSSPAWSLDRLAIKYGKKWVMVSPEDKLDFLRLLMERAGLKPQPDGLGR